MIPVKQHITLQLDAHRVPLEVDRDKESIYRDAALTLNRRFMTYQRLMPQASAEQLWMYVALESAVNLHSDARDKALQPIDKHIQQLNAQIEEIINKKIIN